MNKNPNKHGHHLISSEVTAPYPSDDCLNLELHYQKCHDGSTTQSEIDQYRYVPISGTRVADVVDMIEFDRSSTSMSSHRRLVRSQNNDIEFTKVNSRRFVSS